MKIPFNELKEFLDLKYRYYNNPSFIETDPISIPHQFSGKEDIETSAFLTATISWGNRNSILKSARRLMGIMDFSPYEFIIHSGKEDLKSLEHFVHRTFNSSDCILFIHSLRNIYTNHCGMEVMFSTINETGVKDTISRFHRIFLEIKHPVHAEKHIPDPSGGASAKRINMFLRWMVRNDNSGVDFGIWKNIPPSKLVCPLDVHTGEVARKLGLLARKSSDWKAAEELTENLRRFDPADPVKYDFALFGLGAFERF